MLLSDVGGQQQRLSENTIITTAPRPNANLERRNGAPPSRNHTTTSMRTIAHTMYDKEELELRLILSASERCAMASTL